MLEKVNLAEAFTRFTDTWSPKIAGEVNDMQVKVAKFEGPQEGVPLAASQKHQLG